jgi:transposase
MREKAAALLKVAGGRPGSRVARWGLLKPRKPETVSRWVRQYRSEGIAGLRVRPGRGRKPAFSPSVHD